MVSDDNFVSRSSGDSLLFRNDDQTDVFYIHPNDNPTLVLTSSILNDSNYHDWARSVRMSLISKNKFQFVDGTIKTPAESDRKFHPWVKCNNLVLSWLQWDINLEIGQSVIWIDNAYDLWKDLFYRFNQGDLVRVSNLLQDFYSLQQDDQSWRTIGTTREVNGLYQLEVSHNLSCNVVNFAGSLSLWHSRLGHPSFQRMKYFAKLNSEIHVGFVHEDCDTYHLAKHK